jgi:hypothetical protein
MSKQYSGREMAEVIESIERNVQHLRRDWHGDIPKSFWARLYQHSEYLLRLVEKYRRNDIANRMSK